MKLIASVDENWGIGNEGNLLYKLPEDMKHFKKITIDSRYVIMGRKTFESLPKGALPNRRNIVLSRQELNIENVEVFHSLEEAIAHCNKNEEIFIIGGASVYNEAITLADRLCITYVHDTPINADAYFPEISPKIWQISFQENHTADEKHSYEYSFIDYIKQ